METNLVKSENGRPITTSLLVSDKFGKNHRDVLDSIRTILSSAENSAVLSMFTESSYIALNGKENPMYIMNRDGFSLLVMGFTGKDALNFKLEFIEAFNKMEQAVKTGGFQIPATFSDALMLAAKQAEQIERQNIQIQKTEREKALAEHTIEVQTERIALTEGVVRRQAPKVQYHDEVLNSSRTYTTTQMAKELGFASAEKLHQDLRERKIMYRQSGQWLLTAKYCGKEYTKYRTTPFPRSDGRQDTNAITVWTEAGRQFLHNIYQTVEVY